MGELPGSRRPRLLRASFSDSGRLYPLGRMQWGEGFLSNTDFYSPSEIFPLPCVAKGVRWAVGVCGRGESIRIVSRANVST